MTPLIFNAFVMNSPGHLSPGLWRHADDRSVRYKSLAFWVEFATLLERGLFDGIFIADFYGHYDVFEGSPAQAFRNAVQIPRNDPLLLVSAMAHATRHLGFGVTMSTTYEPPFALARRLSTLDHLTDGRIGWNIVTSASESAARNFGMREQLSHTERYDRAEEYMQLCYKLWEASWEDGAVVADRASGIYADPARIHRIDHVGPHFSVEGPHLCEPSPQRTPVLFQAGASSFGRPFAARHAECVFVGAPSRAVLAGSVRKLRQAFADAGRDPASIAIIAEHTVITAPTAAEAEDKHAAYRQHASREGALTLMSGWTGVDFSQFAPDDVFEHVESKAIRTAVEAMSSADPSRAWTAAEIAEWCGIGGLSPVSVGNPQDVADSLADWAQETGIDGFNLSYAIMDGGFRDFIDLVVPVLQARGLYKTQYREGTLRQKLFGSGDKLVSPHPASAYGCDTLSPT
ncbi:5,10-methylene tetrahydromethanopterin reductase [Pararhizobium polonicum]|uniref:5,10-methylene tetrahydromethanopterin reductase n=1 Tax=Pararhizobium polonicum TaxID=1612624 RepID=A0A1C7NWV9_9HYPH|nr:LLM class flavin-dependent oxidoreductase [Pararhizobium polonicum]OBZ93500.1 5,10-methylene tetrahydromethanopterin reductase [Pararhizobium polonicum]